MKDNSMLFFFSYGYIAQLNGDLSINTETKKWSNGTDLHSPQTITTQYAQELMQVNVPALFIATSHNFTIKSALEKQRNWNPFH